jgi:hypothetical protein
MSGIFDQVINYAPPSLLSGTVTYKGTWSAATNTPTLANPPASITNGNYYVVDTAGTQFTLSFNIGDWIISNGAAWEKVDNTDAVSSVFGRMGAVVGVSTDYSAVGITNTALGASNPSTVAATTITASSTIAATGAVTGSNLSGTNTGDQTITLTGGVTGSGTGSFAATVVTNANLTGAVTSTGNATSLGSFSSANLAGALTDETGSGAAVFATSPTLVTPALGAATATSINGVTVTGTSTPALSVTGTTAVSGTNTGDQTTITGNAGTATILETARNINGVSFNGSADITVAAAAGTLTGATLAAGVTASSLTSLGTIASLTATALTVNDNTTLGSSNADTVNFNARVASDIDPATDNTYDLGRTGHEWRNLNIDGTANIDSLVADTADIDGGTIDATAIGATTPSTGAFTTLSSTGQLSGKGTSTNDNAAAGFIGEYVESVIASASAVSLTTNTAANVTSISLTAGDWDVDLMTYFVQAATTTISVLITGSNSTSATLPTLDSQQRAEWDGENLTHNRVRRTLNPRTVRFSLASTTTIYLIVYAEFGVSTMTAFGTIRARRVR